MNLVTKFMQLYGRPPTEFDPDYLEMLRMGTFRLVERPDVLPHKCASCGSAKEDGRKYADFDLQVDWYGTVFLCTRCLKDIANKAGLFASYEVRIEKLLVSLLQLEEVKKQGVAVREDVLNIFKEVQDYFANLSTIRDESPVDSGDVVDIKPQPSESGVTQNKSGSETTESGSAKSTSVSGSKNISSLAELLDTV